MSAGSGSFSFTDMLQGMNKYIQSVQLYLSQLESSTGGSVNITAMFAMQFQMQIMSQYISAVSNTLSAVNNSMMTMAQATKGQ